jgi:hypothetical protein
VEKDLTMESRVANGIREEMKNKQNIKQINRQKCVMHWKTEKLFQERGSRQLY